LVPYGTPFSTIEAGQFDFLAERLDEVTILGYGEDTHGTAEFTELARELFLYLVAQHGFRTLIIEDSFGPARRMDDYIQGGPGTAQDALWNGNWRYYTAEFVTLLDALRTYNRAHPDDPVRIYGPEMQYVDTDAHYLASYLEEQGEDFDLGSLTEFSTIWNALPPGQLTDHFLLTAKLELRFKENREKWRDADPLAYDYVAQHLEVIRQYLTAHYQSYGQRKHDLRELYMFQNIQWIAERSPGGRAMFWAHNTHVHDGLVNYTADAVGHHLRKEYGERYYALGTDVGGGTLLAHAADANQTGQWGLAERSLARRDTTMFTSCLADWGEPHYFLDFRRARQDDRLREYTRQSFRSLAGGGAQVRSFAVEEERFMQTLDGLIYLERSRPVRQLTD
jgi:erythromycin esterase-like protein